MKKIFYVFFTAILTLNFSSFVFTGGLTHGHSKDNLNRSPRLVNPLYQLTVANIQPETNSPLYPRAITFDIYIYHTNPEESGPFYYSSGQYYLRFNPDVSNGGLLEYEIVPNSTEFTNPDAVPIDPSITVNRLNLERNPPILFVNAPIVSSVFPGTKVVRMRLSSNTPVLNYRDLQLAWIDSTIANPFTQISAFVDSVETDITPEGTLVIDTSYIIFPVELSGFNAGVTRNDVRLNWSTASEYNNSGFDIERAAINSEWEKIGYVKGNGTINSTCYYTFEDIGLNSDKYKYRLKQIDYNGNYEYYNLKDYISVGVPGDFNLKQNYPNPFNPVTKIDFDIPEDAFTSLKVYDLLGNEISDLVSGVLRSGYYSIDFDASSLPSGVYYYRLESGNLSSVRKFTLLK